MDGVGSSACPGPIARYLSGLCAAGLILCAAGWLALTPLAFGYRGHGPHGAALTDLATGGGLAAVCVVTLVAWSVAWRRALRADGVLTRPPRGQARARRRRGRDHGAPDTAAVVPGPRSAPEEPQAVPAGPERIAAIESMLAGAELLMTGCEEEEAW